ncbi:ABC transporter permease [Rhodopirellula sp. MGV]|uniref:ABC transporter permease n=1 Tax=Rhodopirellula sp. MGV TaxID=2023130 RepID=UPI000B9734B2|nr:hypothetical protein [Rhodopirellula sp. MGV]OYP34011.1 hypothetical protein CGZ80_16475 [Rhodopirellula sp. MGV]PNY38362.1 amino acid ABC transporter permease [Rhodopirellula baltica]
MPWLRPLLLTLELMSLSVITATVFGVVLAFCLSLIPRDRWVCRAAVLFCMIGIVGCIATPLVMHAAAWESTAGKFGWLSLSQTSARTYAGIAGRYTGFVASVWIHSLFGSSLVALATLFGTSRIAPSVIESSRFDGGPIWTWWRVRLPLARNWVVASALATAVLAASEMTVVDLYGVRTIADEFYLFYVVDPSLMSVLMLLVLPCVIGITLISILLFRLCRVLDARLIDQQHRSECENDNRFTREVNLPIRAIAFLFAVGYSSLLFAFPLTGIVIKVGQQTTVEQVAGESVVQVHWSALRTAEVLSRALREFSSEYQTTLVIASMTGVLCVSVAWCLVSLSQVRTWMRPLLDGATLALFLIPGPLIGLVLVRFFTLPIPGFSALYQQTLIPTLLALSVRALPVSYWVLRAAYLGLDSQIKDASQMDFGWASRLWCVERPLLFRSLIIAFVGSAIVSSGDVPASMPVIPPGVATVGTRLFGLLHSGARYQEASLAFWYLLFVVVAAILLVRHRGRRPNGGARW